VLDGWRVLRFTWRQICRDPDGAAEQVRLALGLGPR
jgi:very-short-patch-repair endonuclease